MGSSFTNLLQNISLTATEYVLCFGRKIISDVTSSF